VTGAAPALHVRALRKSYRDVVAVDGIDLHVNAGECFGLLGPNGAGKTTTIEICEGLTTPDSGEVQVLGRQWRSDEAELRQRLGVQLQETQLTDKLTVVETVTLFRSFYRQGLEPDDVLRMVQLEEKRRARVGNLSGGQKQRLALACALVGAPEVIFLDEPTTGLDPQARRQLWDLIRAFKREGRTVVLTTHYMDEAEQLCDRVAIMDHGRIIDIDEPQRLVDKYCPERSVILSTADANAAAGLERIPGVESVTRNDSRYTIRGVGDRLITDVIRCVSDNHINVIDFRTETPNLEDVFLKITGHSIRD